MNTTPTHPWPEGSLVQLGSRKYVIGMHLEDDDGKIVAYDLEEPGTGVSGGEVEFATATMALLKGPGGALRMPTAKEVLGHIGSQALGGWSDGPVDFDLFDPTELPEDHRGALIGTGPDGQRIWVEIAVTKIVEADF